MHRAAFLLVIPLLLSTASAADTRLVRETEALTPQEEQRALHVPEGFEAQLFASEPLINKPINLAFDGKGRLWVSSTVEYPYSADKARWSDPQGSHVKDSRDAIKILEDTDGDGKADKVTNFADGLNIPTGVLPWHKPEHKAGCIAWSIPNIWYFADTDGDDKADVREVLFGPLGYEKDTHGMCSSFRLGLDGWVYATHGFNNTSHIKAKDGSSLDLHSGNVFRFRPDGSRVELWSAGQVNPFGLCFDRLGNLYSADCHSAPIYQLLRGAHYPSFSKPHDGLGFGPVMCEHTHGSTGICGITYIDGGVWGRDWDNHMFVGNVVTSRINHDQVTFKGSTPKANEEPDFVTSDDPWFRPVDIQLGPDNALYVADFYNKIIGHYEVPLEHPGRDKERGRIWRIVKKDALVPSADFTQMQPEELAEEIGHPNLTRRKLALQEVKLRGTKEWVPHFLALLKEDDKELQPVGDARPKGYDDETPHDADGELSPQHCNLAAAHALWACSYLGERFVAFRVLRGLHTGGWFVVDKPDENGVLSDSQFGLLMNHATRVIGSYDPMHPWEQYGLHLIFDARGCLSGRAAAEVLLHRPDYLLPGANEQYGFRAFGVTSVLQLLQGMQNPPANERDKEPWHNPEDTQYIHALRLLLRDFFSQPGVLKHPTILAWLKEGLQKPTSRGWILELVRATPTADAAEFMLEASQSNTQADTTTWSHLGRYAKKQTLLDAIALAKRLTNKDSIQAQLAALTALQNGLSERGAPPNPELLHWGQELAISLLDSAAKTPTPSWEMAPQTDQQPAWSLQPRKCADGKQVTVLQSMQKGGAEEQRTGILKSKPFPAPDKLTLWICGHRGPPTAPAHDKNRVRLVDAKTSQVLASAFPPRSDVCQQTTFDLKTHAGKEVRLEIVDGDSGKAYAWLGLTRIEPAVVSVEAFSSEDTTRQALQDLATMLQHTAPAALRDRLSAYLPPRPAPPPLPVSAEQRKQLDALIAARVAAFRKGGVDATKGQEVFAANCAACHQIGGQGGLIGPQLDGIGNRGVERLCEDILDPNRNVDAHFHLHTLTMKDGSTMSGFLKGEAGQVLILADAAGQEHRISKTNLAQDVTTPMSLMPPVFGQTLSEKNFINLLGWLLTK